ncbi:MAG: hypothetical protein QM539_04330 [Alphaproteobacteria bacterium]|nr:hypothetical protein [Alphaproteobacteria bacterium]
MFRLENSPYGYYKLWMQLCFNQWLTRTCYARIRAIEDHERICRRGVRDYAWWWRTFRESGIFFTRTETQLYTFSGNYS